MKAKLVNIQKDNHNIYTFWFSADKPIDNVPGQYTEVYLPHKNPDKRGEKRWFTIFSSPTEDLLAITTKFSDPSSTFKKTLLKLEKGTELNFTEPMGDFVLPKDSSIPLVFIAGGIGITPFRGIIRYLIDIKKQRQITLLYSAQKEDDLVFIDLFNDYKAKVIPILSNPDTDWNGETGRLTAKHLLYLTKPNIRTHFYISGPEPMVENISKDLILANIPKHQIITDYFPGYTDL